MRFTHPLSAILVAFGIVGVYETKAGVLIGEYDLSMVVAHSEFTTPVLSSANEYYFQVSGRYGVGPLDRGDALSDAAFAAYGSPWNGIPWGPLDVRHYPISSFKFDGVANPRPTLDEYRTDHLYTYLLTPRNQTLTVSFDDTPIWDNVEGPLHFKLYQDVSVVPEPSTYLAGLSALGMLGLFGWRNRK